MTTYQDAMTPEILAAAVQMQAGGPTQPFTLTVHPSRMLYTMQCIKALQAEGVLNPGQADLQWDRSASTDDTREQRNPWHIGLTEQPKGETA